MKETTESKVQVDFLKARNEKSKKNETQEEDKWYGTEERELQESNIEAKEDPKDQIILNNEEELKTATEALSGINSENRRKGLEEENSALIQNDTWKLVEPSKNHKIIGCKSVSKLKRDERRKIIRHKARLIALGYSQQYSIDYDQALAPMVRQVTFRMMLNIGGSDNLQMFQFNVTNAFLNRTLEETIYIQEPEGYEKEKNIEY